MLVIENNVCYLMVFYKFLINKLNLEKCFMVYFLLLVFIDNFGGFFFGKIF